MYVYIICTVLLLLLSLRDLYSANFEDRVEGAALVSLSGEHD